MSTCNAFSSSSCDSDSDLNPMVLAVTLTTSSKVMRTSYKFTVSLSSAMNVSHSESLEVYTEKLLNKRIVERKEKTQILLANLVPKCRERLIYFESINGIQF